MCGIDHYWSIVSNEVLDGTIIYTPVSISEHNLYLHVGSSPQFRARRNRQFPTEAVKTAHRCPTKSTIVLMALDSRVVPFQKGWLS